MSRLDAALVLHPSVQKNNAVAAAANSRRVANASEIGPLSRRSNSRVVFANRASSAAAADSVARSSASDAAIAAAASASRSASSFSHAVAAASSSATRAFIFAWFSFHCGSGTFAGL